MDNKSISHEIFKLFEEFLNYIAKNNQKGNCHENLKMNYL